MIACSIGMSLGPQRSRGLCLDAGCSRKSARQMLAASRARLSVSPVGIVLGLLRSYGMVQETYIC